MNLWLIFWTLMLVVAGGSFAAITLVVASALSYALREGTRLRPAAAPGYSAG